MQESCRNIAKIGRNYAGLTQERWAEALGYSVRTVGAWESGELPLTPEAVARMTEVTGQQVLSYWYVRDILPKAILPDVELKPLPEAVLGLLHRLKAFQTLGRVDEIIAIAQDGKVGADERGAYDAILIELDGIVSAAIALRYSSQSEV